jgi:hypothetical protein
MRTLVRIRVQNFALATDIVLVGTAVARNNDIGTGGNLPATNLEEDWSYHSALMAESCGAAISPAKAFEVDIRAKRKVEEQTNTFALCLNNFVGGSRTIDVYTRVLVALA